MAVRYFVGNGTNWSSTTSWSTTSGGASGASVPTAADDVIFDGNSPGNCVIDVHSSCRSADFTGGGASNYTRTIFHNASINWIIGHSTSNGNLGLKFNSSMTYAWGGSSIVYLNSTAGVVQEITSAGRTTGGYTFPYLVCNQTAGSWKMMDVSSAYGFYPWAGTFDTNNFAFHTHWIASTGALSRTLILGSSAVTVVPIAAVPGIINFTGSNYTLNAGTSTVTINANTINASINSGGVTFYNLVIQTGSTGTLTFSDSTIVNQMTATLSLTKTVIFTAGTTLSLTGSGNSFLQGVSGNLITLQSSSAGFPFNIRKTDGHISTDYLSVKDSYAGGGAAFYAGVNSTDVSDNRGWRFSAPPVGRGGLVALM